MAALASGENFTAVDTGKFSDILANHKGKLFLKDLINSTSCEISLSVLPPNGVTSLHAHKVNEEIHIFLNGEGEYLVDGEIFPVKEGSVVRVSPKGKRCIRNTSGTNQLTFICVQAKAGSVGIVGMEDGIMSEEKPQWK